MEEYKSSDEFIAHHGVKGMRWGIRRYQNKDGSLTNAGKRRLAQLQEKRSAIDEAEKLLSGDNPKPVNPHTKNRKSLFEMSDEELNSEIDRLGLEKKYNDYMKELYPKPKQKEALIDGRKIVGDIVTSGLTNIGKNVAENMGGRAVNKLGRSLGLEYDLYTKSQKKKND